MNKVKSTALIALLLCWGSAAVDAQTIQRPLAGDHPIEKLHFLLGVWDCEYFYGWQEPNTALEQQYSSTITYRLMPGGYFIGSDEVIVDSKKGYPLGWHGSEFIGRIPQPSYVHGTPENLQPLQWLIAGGEGGYAGWLNGVFTLQTQKGRQGYLKHPSARAIEWDWPPDKWTTTARDGVQHSGYYIGALERCKRSA